MLESNNYLQKTFNLIPAPSIIIKPNSPHFSIVAINDAYINLINGTKQDLIGQHFRQVFPYNLNTTSNAITMLNESLDIVLNTFKTHIIGHFRFDIPKKGSNQFEVKYWSIDNTPILNDDGSIETILQTITDITEKTLLQDKKAEYEKENIELQAILKEIDTPAEIGTWELHLETGKLFLSDNYFRICGFEPNGFEPTVENITQLIHPEDRERANKARFHAIETIGSYRIEKRIIRPSGEIITVLSTGVVTKNDAGKATSITGIYENITGTKQLEQVLRDTVNSLRERNEFIETIIKNLPIGIAVNKIDDGSATMLNNRFSEIYGWQETDFKDVTTFFDKVFPKEDYGNTITETIVKDIQSGDASKMCWNNVVVTTSAGEKKIINAKNIPLFDQNLMISTVIDVTDTAKQTAEITRIKNNSEAIINSTDDIIFSLDKNFKLVTLNKVYQNLLKSITGRTENEGDVVLTGKLGKELTAKWKSYFERAFKGEKFTVNEEVFNPMQGITQYGLVNFNPVFNSNGEVESVACFAKDVTTSTVSHLQLQKTKNELDKILAASLDVICVVNKDNVFVKVSAASQKVWGYQPEELIGHSIFEFIHPDYAAHTKQATLDVMKGQNVTNFENKYIKKDGSIVTIEWSARWDEKEQMRYGIARDITEKKKNEITIIESEKQYKSLFEDSPLPMFIWEFETKKLLNCNYEALELYGYTKEEFLSLTLFDIRPEEDIPLLNAATINEEVYGKVHKQAWRHKKKNGEIIQVNIHAHVLDYQGTRASLVLVHDITEKLKIEDTIKQTNERYEYVIKATSDAIWDWNLDNGKLLWGDGFNTLFGYNLADIESKNINFHINLIHPDDRQRINESYLKIVKNTNNNWEESYRLKKADGTYAYIIDKGFVIRNKAGRTIRIVGAKRDITLNRYYNELEKLERNILAYRQMGEKNVVETLTTYILAIEELHPGMMCGVSEKKGHQLFSLAGPSLPKEYNQLINGVSIGNNVGSCGTACYIHEKVIVGDIENDVRWADFKHIVSQFNLASCWSYPIMNLKGEVMGTFAIYNKEKKTPTELEENTINRVVNIIQIIIESANRTKALEESNLRYNYVTKATSDAIYDWNLEDNSVFWGDVFFKIFGWDLQKMNAKVDFCFDRIHPNDKDKLLTDLFSAINGTAITWAGEYRFLKADDSYAYVIDQAYIIRNVNKKAIRVVGSKRDVTIRRQELIRLKLLESVITNTNDVVVISEVEMFDASGPKIVYVNEAFTKLTGYQPEEIIGKTPRLIQGSKTDQQELQKLKEYMEALKPCEITLVNYKKNGEEYWVNINLNPVMDENGRITHWVSLQRDVTDKKQQEINMVKAIIKTQEDERYEVGGELHDNVSQILTSSQIALKMIKTSLPEIDLQRLKQGIDYISLATHEIRNLSHRLAPAFFNETRLDEAFENLVKSFNVENDYEIHLNFDAEFKTLPVKREFQLNLYRILQEQLKNILKYSAANRIDINGYVQDDYLVLSVYDNGVGFDVTSVKKGIGIANMRRRVELFSGKFSIQSSEGSGCIILIEIPIKAIN